jgi:phosphonoacetaldehyde hydrolase
MAEARGPMGLHKKDHLREMLKTESVGNKWRNKLGRRWSESDIEELYRRVTPMQVTAAKAHSTLIPGVLECVRELKALGIKIAGTTGYFREAAEVCYAAGKEQGYQPDFVICADEVPAGRPKPWMIFRAMEALDVYPPSRVVKVGDTLVDIEDGLNAGVHSVAVVDSSSEMGLSEAEFAALPHEERESRRKAVREKFKAAGASWVIDDLSHLQDALRILSIPG